MRNYHTTTDDWVGNVTRGESNRERYEDDVFWFRGNVLFKHHLPIMRLERTVDDSWMTLGVMEHHWPVYRDKAHNGRWLQRSNPIDKMIFESIGVFWSGNSKGALQGKDLHHFMQRQIMANGEAVVDLANRMGIKRMDDYGKGTLITMAQRVLQEHGDYRRKLCPTLPGIMDYSDIVRAVCDKRLSEYNEPKKKQQRERNAARRLAKKALNL
jgi:hypothetical protein